MTEPVDWAGRTFGELTPDEKRRAAAHAAEQVGAELQANAGLISAILDSVDEMPEPVTVYAVVREAEPGLLAVFGDEEMATKYIGGLPGAEDGAYGIDYPTELTPRQIDELNASLHDQLAKVSAEYKRAIDAIHEAAGDRQRYEQTSYGYQRVWQRPQSWVEDILRGMVVTGEPVPPGRGARDRTPAELLAAPGPLLTERARIQIAIMGAEALWRVHRWPRYILCISSNGHIHNYDGCHTLRPTSLLQWHPEFSGLTESQAVHGTPESEGLGPILCTVCFPSAPVEYKRDPAEVSRERNADAKAAEREAREAKKAAKQLRPGEVITVNDGRHGERITTVAAAKDALRREVEFRDYYGSGTHSSHAAWAEAARLAAEVLIAREAEHEGWGATQEQIDTIIANAVKKNRKDGARI